MTADADRRDLYVLAFTIVRADETVSGAERIYLAQLAHALGLDPATAAALEQQTAAAIDGADADTADAVASAVMHRRVGRTARRVSRHGSSARAVPHGQGAAMQGAQQWYMAIGGHQVGPVSQDEILANLRNGSIDKRHAGVHLGDGELAAAEGRAGLRRRSSTRRRPAGVVPPPPSAPGRRAHDIDFTIHGNEMQFVEVELDPGEAAVAEAGSMMYMTDGVQLETIFGDGSRAQPAGVLDALLGAGKRLLTGESLFMTVFTNHGAEQAAGGVCGALRRQDHPDGSARHRRAADLPEGLVPVRRPRRVGGHRLPAQDRRRHLRR